MTDLTRNDQQFRVVVFVCWALVLAAAVFAYSPGLAGPFVFDDLESLGALGNFGGVRDWATFKLFVLGGEAGPTGRPLAMLTFLIDGNNWPAEAWPFKRTNLVMHLANGVLLGMFIFQILGLLEFRKRDAFWIALVAAAFWLLHPFLVSTTLYVVQRMAQLATFFVLAGLNAHLYGRAWLDTRPVRGYLIMTISIGLFTLLGLLSKENGVLLPVLIGVVEFTVIASLPDPKASLDKRWSSVFIVFPSIMIVAYLGFRAVSHDFFDVVPPRDFSIYERLLTQPRVLLDYLLNWFIPKLYTTGVFQDHIIKSTGIITPIATLLSALLHAGLIAAAITYRRRLPLLALAVLFFYAGHLIESTTLSLELYFEHRNYLPASLLVVPVVAFLHSKMRPALFAIVVVGMLAVLGGFTRYSSTVWADFSTMVEASARKAPTSARAQTEYAKALFNAQRYQESLQIIDQAIARIPDHKPHLIMSRLTMLCSLGVLTADEFRRVSVVLAGTVYDPRLISIYHEFAQSVTTGTCPDVTLDALHSMFIGLLAEPHNADKDSLRYSQIQYFTGFVDAHNQNPTRAVAEFEESLRSNPSASAAMNMAALLANNGHFSDALRISALARAEQTVSKQSSMNGESVSQADIDRFEAIIRAEIDAAQDDGSIDPAE